MLILLIILILVFGFGGYRMGPGLGYYGGGGISLILSHRSHSAFAQSYLAAIAQSSHPCGGVRRLGDSAAIVSNTYRFADLSL